MKRFFLLFAAAVVTLSSCGVISETWTLEVSEHDPNKTSFTQNWHTTSVTVFYYPNSIKWEDAINLAYFGDWTGAISKWMSILEGNITLDRRRSAEYNIALGCHLMGQWALADDWISQSIADYGSGSIPACVRRVKSANDAKLKKYGRQR